MKYANMKIRKIADENNLTFTDIAQQMGVTRIWLSKLMCNELSHENETRILKAIDALIKQKTAKRAKYASEERVNFVIPSYIKDYLQAAAYRASDEKHIVSMTEYLCDLIVADMETNK